MSEWKYKLGNHSLSYVNEPIVTWNKTEETQDNSYLIALIDAEIHELNKVMKTIEDNIYWLGRYRSTLRKDSEKE